MANVLRIDRDNNTIIMDRAFAKASAIVGSEEYNMLQTARRDYPTYTVVRRKIKRNPNKECYRGLTYEYMEKYIRTHCQERLPEYMEMRLISECHSVRYPTIKKWFLKAFPEIVEFGISEGEKKEETPGRITNIEKAATAA